MSGEILRGLFAHYNLLDSRLVTERKVRFFYSWLCFRLFKGWIVLVTYLISDYLVDSVVNSFNIYPLDSDFCD